MREGKGKVAGRADGEGKEEGEGESVAGLETREKGGKEKEKG